MYMLCKANFKILQAKKGIYFSAKEKRIVIFMSSEVINEKVQLERKTIIAHYVVIFKKIF